MRDKKKTKSGLLTLVVLTLMIFAVALIFFSATPSSANDGIQGYICPPGFERNTVIPPSTPPDRNGNGWICNKGQVAIDDSIIFYDACVSCHGLPNP